MFTIPNFISFLRMPLILVFLQNNPKIRVLGILLAMVTDVIDGFLARRYRLTSQAGAILDPLMDKVFVIAALLILFSEQRLTFLEMTSMLCRDFSVMFFGLYLMMRKKWSRYQFRSIISGKITTALQLIVLMALTMHIELPSYVFLSFIVLGVFALFELYLGRPQSYYP